MQTSESKAHMLYSKIGELLFKVMNCFMKENFLLNIDKTRKEAKILGKLKVSAENMKHAHNIALGTHTGYLVANLEVKESLTDLKLQFRSCYESILTYLQSHLPHDSIILRDIQWIQPENKLFWSDNTKRSAFEIAKVLKNSKFTTHSPETYADIIAMEFAIYKTESIDYPGEVTDPIENYWSFVGEMKDVDGNLKFNDLSTLALTCLSISHANAVPERGFSQNKKMLDGRESLSEEIIEATRLVKESVMLHGGILNFPITRRLLNLVEDSHRCYEQHLENEKAKAAFELAQKSVTDDLQAIENENSTEAEKQKSSQAINLKIAEEYQKIMASNNLLAEGKNILEKTIRSTKVKKEDLLKVNALMTMAIENSEKANRNLIELTNKKNELEKKSKRKKKKTSSTKLGRPPRDRS